jgi:hypothetical protein
VSPAWFEVRRERKTNANEGALNPACCVCNPPCRAARQLFSAKNTFLLCSNDSQSKHIYGANPSHEPTQSVESWSAHFSYWARAAKTVLQEYRNLLPTGRNRYFYLLHSNVQKHSDGHWSRRY